MALIKDYYIHYFRLYLLLIYHYTLSIPSYGVAVSDTYQDEISNGYFIRDRIYYGQRHIPGWHTYPGMVHLPGNFISGTLTQPNEIAFMRTTRNIPGHTALSVDHTHNSWAYSTLGRSCA